jgi:hypothetical protein
MAIPQAMATNQTVRFIKENKGWFIWPTIVVGSLITLGVIAGIVAFIYFWVKGKDYKDAGPITQAFAKLFGFIQETDTRILAGAELVNSAQLELEAVTGTVLRGGFLGGTALGVEDTQALLEGLTKIDTSLYDADIELLHAEISNLLAEKQALATEIVSKLAEIKALAPNLVDIATGFINPIQLISIILRGSSVSIKVRALTSRVDVIKVRQLEIDARLLASESRLDLLETQRQNLFTLSEVPK